MPEQTTTINTQVVDVAIAGIIPSPYQTRHIDEESADMKELAESIKEKGIIQPITLRVVDSTDRESPHQLVCGERRWRAANLAGLPTVPCIVRDLTDQEALEIVTIENFQREDLTPMEQAEGVAQFLDGGFDVDSAAKALGYTRKWIYTRAQLVKLSPAWKEAIAGPLKTGWESPGTYYPSWGIGHLELVAQYVETAQDEILLTFIQRNSVPTIKDLKDKISTLVRQLGKAPFDLDDVELLPAAGACSGCPKRRGAMPDLFGGVVDDLKKDTCLDQVCFQEKIDAHTLRVVEEAKVKNPDVIEIAASKWFNDSKIVHKDGKHFQTDDTLMEKCRKDDKEAKVAIVTEGIGKGQSVYVKPVKKLKDLGYHSSSNGSTGNRKTIGQRRKDLEARREFKAVEVFRGMLEEITWQHLVDQGVAAWDLLPLVGALKTLGAYHVPDNPLWDTTSFSSRLAAWWELDPDEVPDVIWLRLRYKILDDLPKKDCYGGIKIDDMGVLCDFVGVDWPALLQQAIEQHPEPKSWQGLKAGDYPGAKKVTKKKEVGE